VTMRESEPIQFAICLDNEGYEGSLEVGKLYQVIPDDAAACHGYVNVIDESGEDYAFSANRFHLIQLPGVVKDTLLSKFDSIQKLQ